MASSSTSSIHKTNFKYDVFLSFRGEDTRTNFVDHLYHALEQESIETYKDDKKLEQGKRIGKELFEAIKESRFHVVVFSQNYASSSWCLDELVKIMECQKTMTEHTVYPIFYHVEPTEVRKQSGEFGKAFPKHEKVEVVEKWREALKEAADMSGWELKGHEVEFIKMVVDKISLKLPSMSADENLVGMRTRISRVVSSLNASPDEFFMMGITGMGGIGKTTLARAVFDQICNEFEGSSFVENVRECSNSLLLGLKSLQQQVLRDVLNRQDLTINGVFDGKKIMKKNMPGKKALIVLDDVDDIEQLKALAGQPNWFKPGSKIIITTRDKQVLLAHKIVNSIHDVNLLTSEEAICLLSRCAFGTENPSEGFEELSRQVASYADGLPLTITILGSSLYGENERVWIDTLKELEKIPLDGTLQRLELSYTSLDTNCQEIFLDVACILKGWKEDDAIKVLESRGFHAIRGLSVLEKRSLITISGDRRLYMHDHIEEMGQYIVRRPNLDDPSRHSRLWIKKEIIEILDMGLGTEATTCIYLDLSPDINSKTLMKGFGKMKKLRFLFVCNFGRFSNWEFDEVSQYFPNSLRYLKWKEYPFHSLPKTLEGSNLVGLELCLSKMQQLWEGGERKVLHKLRFLDLSYSFFLKTFDLKLTPNIESLNLEGCGDLVELNMTRECPQLKYLIVGCRNLKSLNLHNSILPNLEYLKLIDSKLTTLKLTHNLHTLFLEGCDLVELQIPNGKLKSLDIKRCSELKTLDITQTPNLEILRLQDCYNLVNIHAPVGGLKKLILLESEGNLRFKKFEILDMGRLPELSLSAMELTNRCPLHPDNIQFPKLRIDCSYKEDLPSSIGNIEKLISVGFSCVCTDLESFFGSICGLQNLTKLKLEYIPEVPKDLDQLQYLEELTLQSTTIKHLPDSICTLKHLKILKLDYCTLLEKLPEDLGQLERLEKLTMTFTEIKHLPDSICMLKHLKVLELKCCKLLEKLPEDVDRLECLEILKLEECILLQDIPNNICRMKSLKHIILYKSFGVKKLPEELGRLDCLEELDITGTSIDHLPQSILSMKKGLNIVGSKKHLESCGLTSEMKTSKGITLRYRDDKPQKAKQADISQHFNSRPTCVLNPRSRFNSSTDPFPEYFEGSSTGRVHDLFGQPKSQFTKNHYKRR